MPKPSIDLAIFTNKNEINNKCDASTLNINADINELCIQLKRLIYSHNYYKALDLQNSDNDKEKFRQFMMEIYCNDIINDYEHLMVDHKHDLYPLNQIILKTSKSTTSTKCILSNCESTQRHYIRDEITDKGNEAIDVHLLFFCQLFDSVHFYLYHCFECSLRMIPKQFRNDNNDEKDDNISEFKTITNKIRESRTKTDKFQRFSSSNAKFNIAVNPTQNSGLYSLFPLCPVSTYFKQ